MRILCMDYGGKRTGIAVTDPLQIIATGLKTVETKTLMDFLKAYVKAEPVERFVIGMPLGLDDEDTHNTQAVRKFIVELKQQFPTIPVDEVDERYSSKMASRAMVEMGMKKKQRREKGRIDEIAATMMLQEYMERRH